MVNLIKLTSENKLIEVGGVQPVPCSSNSSFLFHHSHRMYKTTP